MPRERVNLYPEIKPYKKGFLSVGSGHKLYYEECGNPNGKPILYIHGGPGAGCSEDSRRFFDPKKWRIILFDQRGSGRSKPFGSIENNTTWDLMDDMVRLLDELNIMRAVLFGGSWGTTLSLMFSIWNRDRVAGMILRGIWLANKFDLDHYIRGGVAKIYPKVWGRFVSQVPKEHAADPLPYYYKRMTSGTRKGREHFAYEWARYEMSALHLRPLSEEALDAEIKSMSYVSLGIMEAHYITNGCFIDEDYIVKNASSIPKVPIVMVHGTEDAVCPVISAYRLWKALAGPNAYLRLVLAGHAGSEPEIRKTLIAETNKILKKI